MKQKALPVRKNHTHITDGLAHLLADTYTLYLKTQNFHWNVTGPHFHDLHLFFEAEYKLLADATDVIAERLRALGEFAPASFSKFLMLTSLQEAKHPLSAHQMIKELLHDHETIASHLSKLFETADKQGDQVTLDLFIERKNAHDKSAWMLRSMLK
jgi:starvation-inducible DNA-binding protein